ncbi:hypothetical protein BBJ28_00006817 [Nothophytophthora sp. Chile5]|nr:hypothetical protein BBJ28_00006817 [Nothophytophthora sp. Chile5]
MASASRWSSALAVFVAAACAPAPPFVGAQESFIRIPLYKQSQPSIDASLRLAHVVQQQQARARRRVQEEPGNGGNDFGEGALALSESPLGVGYGFLACLLCINRTHYAEIYLGIPAQRASVIVDTGSHLTALPCSTCLDCGQHTDPLFDVTKSTTAKYMTCHDFGTCSTCQEDRCYISQVPIPSPGVVSYTEGSMWQAVVVDELVWVGGFSSQDNEVETVLRTFGFRFLVGCQTKETGLFITQKENGIMGLGRHRSTVMSHMLAAGRVTHDLFTLCFAGDGGELVFGGVDYSHHTSAVAYTPLLNDNSAYYPVYVKDIRVNGASLGIDAGTLNSGKGVIVDSGTTDTFFAASGKRSFQNAFEAASGGKQYNENRMQFTDAEVKALPTISIVLSGMNGDGSDDVQLDIPATKYLTPSDDGYYYGNFHFSERSGGGKSYVDAGSNSSIPPLDTTPSNAETTDAPTTSNATTITNAVDATDDATGSNTEDAATKRSSPSIGAFIAEGILISLVGIALAVVVWTRWRTRAWQPIPEVAESSRAHMQVIDVDPVASPPSSSPPSGRVLSPRSRAARKLPSPKFTVGSSGEEDGEGQELHDDDETMGVTAL